MQLKAASQEELIAYPKIVLFGDSITQEAWNPEWFSHGAALASIYARKMDVMNRGYGGYNTNQAVDLVPRLFPIDDTLKLVVVSFGANDAVLGGGAQHVSLEAFSNNLRRLAVSLQVSGTKVILMTPPPIDGYAADPSGMARTAENTKLYAEATQTASRELNVPLADVWTAMMKSVGWTENTEGLPGSLRYPRNSQLAGYFRDGLHPVGAGYRIIYNEIMKTIRENLPEFDPDRMQQQTPRWDDLLADRATL